MSLMFYMQKPLHSPARSIFIQAPHLAHISNDRGKQFIYHVKVYHTFLQISSDFVMTCILFKNTGIFYVLISLQRFLMVSFYGHL
jgi:hypothetical protein